MRSGNLPQKFLVQLILLVLYISLVKTENLEFYQDVEPEQPMDVNYEEMARYLEAQKQTNMRNVNRNELLPNLQLSYAEYLYYRRQKEKKILEALIENPNILEALKLQKAKEHPIISESHYNMLKDLSRVNNPERLGSYMRINPLNDRYDDYNNFKTPNVKDIFRNEKPGYVHSSLHYPLRMSPLNNENYPIVDMNVERLMKLEGKLMDVNDNRRGNLEEDETARIFEQEPPEFTFKFDEPKLNQRDTFAIRPNNPRYYYEDDETSTVSSTIDEQTTTNREKIVVPFQQFINADETIKNMPKTDTEYTTENILKDKFSIMKIILPEAHRRTDDGTVVVSSSRIKTNDIYFIAIVAGCSAAAMFALVLISLTWCRLQRGAKAAADIEYPAYGVTGPNKDISPSGDQRLAHSAQMYHFQHQKQQIIAMENRTAASRDTGSVSEAESDEENEEGDYTVYECPGLASTGEMEVKNPMFNDDPTPATPPQIHKDEDHI